MSRIINFCYCVLENFVELFFCNCYKNEKNLCSILKLLIKRSTCSKKTSVSFFYLIIFYRARYFFEISPKFGKNVST